MLSLRFMIAGVMSHGDLQAAAGTPWWAVVVLTAVAIYEIVGIVGSFARLHSAVDYGDDQHWFLGFYNNPDDEDLFVKVRSLPQITVNLARVTGKAIMLFSLLVFVGLDILIVISSRS